MEQAVTGPTREDVLRWVREAFPEDERKHLTREVGPYDITEPIFYTQRFAALAFAAGARSSEDARDAARYRWLREHTAHIGLSRFIWLSGHQLLDAAVRLAVLRCAAEIGGKSP